MAIGKDAGEPHDLEVDARYPIAARIESLLYLGGVHVQIELAPRPLQPDIVKILPVHARTTRRIFNTDQHCVRKSLSQRACDADTGLWVSTGIKAAYING